MESLNRTELEEKIRSLMVEESELHKELEKQDKKITEQNKTIISLRRKLNFLLEQTTIKTKSFTTRVFEGIARWSMRVGVVAIILVAYMATPNEYIMKKIDHYSNALHMAVPGTPNIIVKEHNGIISMMPSTINQQLYSNDNVNLTIKNLDISLQKVAMMAGFDGVLYGKVIKKNNQIVLVSNTSKDNSEEVPMKKVLNCFEDLGCHNVLAIVDNPGNIVLPKPILVTSMGKLSYYQNMMKFVTIIPKFWDDTKQLNINSDNVSFGLSVEGMNLKAGKYKAEMAFYQTPNNTPEEIREQVKNMKAELKILKQSDIESFNLLESSYLAHIDNIENVLDIMTN